MIPWVREKFAEKKASWLAARNKRPEAEGTSNCDSTETLNISGTSDSGTSHHHHHHRMQQNESPVTTTRSAAESGGSSDSTPTQVRKIFRANGRPARRESQQLQQQQSDVVLSDPANDATLRTRSQSMISDANRTVTAANSAPATPPPQRRRQFSNSPAQCLTPQLSRITKLRRHCSTPSGTPIPSNVLQTGSKGEIVVRVISPSARILAIQVDSGKRLLEFKIDVIVAMGEEATSWRLFTSDIHSLSKRYRLFRAEFDRTELDETRTLSELGILNNDTLVVVRRRYHMQNVQVKARDTRPPHESIIEIATKKIPVSGSKMPLIDINEIFQQSNIQFDVRKVLISLAQASAVVIGAGPYAGRLIEMLKQKLINKRDFENDRVQCLVDMGFTSDMAEYALKLNNNSYSAALEYLLQHQDDDTTGKASTTAQAGVCIQKSQSLMSPSSILTNHDIIENTSALLEIVRIYSHREMPPTADTVDALVEMGFEEIDVLHALRKTCNNKAAACEWLCGNRTGSLFELRDGLAQDSPILEVILKMPQVQMNLSNPKILLAFLSILENENSIRVWGGDNDTTSVITHILQKYHEEKHVLGINQFYLNRL